MNIKGSQSEKNIRTALTGESFARNKYTFYALQARKEGHDDIAEMFETMATNETNHAKIWFNILNGGLGTTKNNIIDAANGENGEWMNMYPNFAKVAREEGFEELAQMFERIAEIEKDHEKRFLKALVSLNAQTRYEEKVDESVKDTNKIGYRCMFCGATYESRQDVCSVCEAIGSFEKCVIE